MRQRSAVMRALSGALLVSLTVVGYGATAYADETVKYSQTVTYSPAIADQVWSGSDVQVALNATSDAGIPLTFYVASGPAVANGSTLTINGAGTIDLLAYNNGNDQYWGVTHHTTILVTDPRPAQTIFFPAIPDQSWTGSYISIRLNAISTSGGPVKYSVVSGPAYLSNADTIVLRDVGTVVVAADQVGTPVYAPAATVQTSINVVDNRTAQTITFPAIADQVWPGHSFTIPLNATASSGLPVKYAVLSDVGGGSNGPLVGYVNTSPLTIVNTGTIAVVAMQDGNDQYKTAPQVTIYINILPDTRLDQTITFPAISNQSWLGGTFELPLNATSTSGLPVTYTVVSGPASVYESFLTVNGVGTVVLEANQAGNGNFLSASAVQISFVVTDTRSTQTITAPSIPTQYWTGSAYTLNLNATASSGLPVEYAVTGGPAVVNGSALTVTGTGNISLLLSQYGNSQYKAAQSVLLSFNVANNKLSQTITFPAIANQTWAGTPYTLTLAATASSGLPVRYGVMNGSPATVSGNILTIRGGGTVTLVAIQDGNTSYFSAPYVYSNFTVTDIRTPQTITFPTVNGLVYNGTTYAVPLTATSSSGLPVGYSLVSGGNMYNLSGSNLIVNHKGTYVIAAIQLGNTQYSRAIVNQTFVVQ